MFYKTIMLLLLLVTTVNAQIIIEKSVPYLLLDDTCYGTAEVRVKSIDNYVPTDFDFPGCSYSNNKWYCECNNNTAKIYFVSNVNKDYDVITEYYNGPAPINDNDLLLEMNKRTKNFNDITTINKKFGITNINVNKIIIYLLLPIVLLIIIIGVLILMFYSKGKNDDYDKGVQEILEEIRNE